ncbi:hypothetical protein AMIS_79590 [Actinoplanes missouriensis 431]|uniref:Uncharacterized protein n=1 Tax=Actinoplanes missouriensis (strain ATCC 14538 / DSM 43046 / CBS 188.64 / JCM 3121 / NBRC 102363 / NCIMB 12654 / NRRL B-3342 / UNCC 431) TaxID=512565 RepID=I0HJJ2_ACTM4|nr:hypothetical protein [Actinoplanes missouriensis]BAL93179.1 hypothetical protein AMIS_79590 [Actinoplanes missouriensis 431]
MTGIIAIELRRSGALLAGAATAVLGVAGLYVLALTGQTGLWDQQWNLLAVFQRIMLVVLWPLAVAAGAWQAGRDRRSRMEELLGATPAPGWRRLLPSVLATALCLVAGYLLVLAAGAPKVAAVAGHPGSGWPAVTAVGVVALIAAGVLGLGAGRLLPYAYTPAVLGAGSLAGLLAAIEATKIGDATRPGAALLLPFFTSTISEFQEVGGVVTTGQAWWFGGLVAGGLVLYLATNRVVRVLAVVPPALGLLLGAPLLTVTAENAFPIDPAAVTEVCTTDDGPRVCVTAAHRRMLPDLVAPSRNALRLMAELPDAPTSVHEAVPGLGRPQPAAEAWLDTDNLGATDDPAELTARVLAGAGTPLCVRNEESAYLDVLRARAVTAAWLYGSHPVPGPGFSATEQALRDTMWTRLRALPAQEQQRRVAAVRAAGLTCGDQAGALGLGAGR